MQINNINKIIKSNKHNVSDDKKRKRDENREIGIVTYAFVVIFLCMIAYLGYFTQFQSRDIINNTYNRRQSILEERLLRGDILARNGEILASTVYYDDDKEVRVYPYADVFAHAVGYSTRGVLGVERLVNFKLLECDDNIVTKIRNDIVGIKNKGNSAITTFDTKLQQTAYDALGKNKGAVIVMNAQTGEILAMVSKPDFNPNDIDVDVVWDELNSDNVDSPLLNRAVSGVYPPGSTFKIVTALEYLKENERSYKDYSYDCYGSFTYKGTTINCYHGQNHGDLDFHMSFAKSCNSSFANITSTLDKESFKSTCNDLLFDSELPLPFAYSKSHATISANSSMDELLQTGIGQGKTLVTPIHIALITSAIANDGILMQPYVIDEIESVNGRTIEKTRQKEYGRLLAEDDAEIMCDFMRVVVTDGTAKRLNSSDKYKAYGKTGSAEYSLDKSQSHAWFTGFASDGNDTIVATVIVECGGSGGEVAAPIAKSIFDAYY